MIVYSDVLLNDIKPSYSHCTCLLKCYNKTLFLLCRESAVFVSHVVLGGLCRDGLLFYFIFLVVVKSWSVTPFYQTSSKSH